MEMVKRIPVVSLVRDQLKKMIEEEKPAPGTKLPAEMSLCKQLGVSRGTVREACRMLQAEGIVELKDGRGIFVAEKRERGDASAIKWLVDNEEDLRSALEVRMALEPLAARLAAEHMSEEDRLALFKLHQDFLDCAKKGGAEETALADEAFHAFIAEHSGNAMVADVIRLLNGALRAFREHTFQVYKNAEDAVGPHKAITRALLAGEGAKAEREMRRHIIKTGSNLTLNIFVQKGQEKA